MSDKAQKLMESTIFMAGMTALGGFCNAYTGITRGGVFANAHTANMAKLGISLFNRSWPDAFNAVVPIIGCLAGSVLCELVKDKTATGNGHASRDWRRRALLLELLALFVVGFVPVTVPHMAVNAFMSFVTGFQLAIFRTWQGSVHNTTICTGNLRSLGQYLYAALARREPVAVRKMLTYAALVFSFCLGAVVSAALCLLVGVRASWAGCVFLLTWLCWMYADERKAVEQAVGN